MRENSPALAKTINMTVLTGIGANLAIFFAALQSARIYVYPTHNPDEEVMMMTFLYGLLIGSAILAIPMLYFCAQWFRLWYQERRQIADLVQRAEALPDDPKDFTTAEILYADKIRAAANRLPCTLPQDIPGLKKLYK